MGERKQSTACIVISCDRYDFIEACVNSLPTERSSALDISVTVCGEVPDNIVSPMQINYRQPQQVDATRQERLQASDELASDAVSGNYAKAVRGMLMDLVRFPLSRFPKGSLIAVRTLADMLASYPAVKARRKEEASFLEDYMGLQT